MPSAYYNEFDKHAAAWLRELIRRGLIAPGEVDERSILEVKPDDLRGFTQCHFFAGIGGWSYALRLAGWPDDRPVWTGSCPCQPFSVAGKQAGSGDERHLWPAFFGLISECRPVAVFGEQVASALGRAWLDHVCADLESAGYAAAAANLPACSVGAPHIRQRLWFVADSQRRPAERHGPELASEARGMQGEARQQRIRHDVGNGDAVGGMGNAEQPGLEGFAGDGGNQNEPGRLGTDTIGPVAEAGPSYPWRELAWLPCRDGKTRPTQPAVQCMAYGISYCLGQLRPEQEKEIGHAAEASGIGEEIMRALREGDDPAALWQSIGRCIGFSKATLLFSALLKQSGELGRIVVGSPSNIEQALRQGMPAVRQDRAASRTPHRPRYTQQRANEFADAVHSLSLGFASLNRFTGSPLAINVSDRVGRLRAYGNAIVPQVAAKVIGAYMDICHA